MNDKYRCPVCGVSNKFRERIRETFYYNSQGDIIDKYIFPDEKILECCTCSYKAIEKEFRVDYREEQLQQDRKKYQNSYKSSTTTFMCSDSYTKGYTY